MFLVFLFFIIAVLIGADQAVKYWALNSLKPKGSMEFIHFGDFKILDLTYLENRGALFGSMAGKRWFLVGVTACFIAAMFVLMIIYARKNSKFVSFTAALFVAGGIGNLADRIRLGYVVDMFDIKLFEFAVFNVADICVTTAVAMMLIYFIFIEPKYEKRQEKQPEDAKAAENE